MRFQVEPRDVPPEYAARRLGLNYPEEFEKKLLRGEAMPPPNPELVVREDKKTPTIRSQELVSSTPANE
jgi:hypothetical protein